MTKLKLLEQDYETVFDKRNKPIRISKSAYIDDNHLNRSKKWPFAETYKAARELIKE